MRRERSHNLKAAELIFRIGRGKLGERVFEDRQTQVMVDGPAVLKDREGVDGGFTFITGGRLGAEITGAQEDCEREDRGEDNPPDN